MECLPLMQLHGGEFLGRGGEVDPGKPPSCLPAQWSRIFPAAGLIRVTLLMSLAVARTLVLLLSLYDFVDDDCVADNESTVRQGFVCLLKAFVNCLDKA